MQEGKRKSIVCQSSDGSRFRGLTKKRRRRQRSAIFDSGSACRYFWFPPAGPLCLSCVTWCILRDCFRRGFNSSDRASERCAWINSGEEKQFLSRGFRGKCSEKRNPVWIAVLDLGLSVHRVLSSELCSPTPARCTLGMPHIEFAGPHLVRPAS